MKHFLTGITLMLSAILPGHAQHLNIESIESWADAIIQPAMDSYHVPGLAFSVVSRDSVIVSKGYGQAKLNPVLSIDPLRTHFDMGSIPKALTAIALMQLIDQGKIDVHQDIREMIPYLHQTNELDGPISLHQLLTHSAGLDDLSNLGSASRFPDEVPPLQEFIRSQPIHQVMEGSIMTSYSNIGYAMIGAVIEHISGRSFPEYMQDFLLDPLEMHHSSFYAALDDTMESRRAIGYEFINGSFQAAPINYQFNSPAAGLRSTAGDMAHVVQMLLNEGQFRGQRILSESSVKTILSRQFSNHPDLPGLGYSLREEHYDGWEIWAQNGAWQGFNHDFFLIPEAGLGMVICLNTDEGSQLAEALMDDFARIFLAPKQIEEVPLAQSPSFLEEYAGIYRGTRSSRHSITKFGVLLGFVSELEVDCRNDSLFYYGTALLYEGNDVFRRADGLGKIAFLRNAEGDIHGLARSYSQYEAHEKISFYQSSKFHLRLFALLFFSLLLISFISILQYVNRKRNKLSQVPDSKAILLQLLSALLPIIWLAGIALEFSTVEPWDYQYGATQTLRLLLAVPFVLMVLEVYMIYYLFQKPKAFPGKGARFLFISSLLVLLFFLLFLHHWNLLGYQY